LFLFAGKKVFFFPLVEIFRLISIKLEAEITGKWERIIANGDSIDSRKMRNSGVKFVKFLLQRELPGF